MRLDCSKALAPVVLCGVDWRRPRHRADRQFLSDELVFLAGVAAGNGSGGVFSLDEPSVGRVAVTYSRRPDGLFSLIAGPTVSMYSHRLDGLRQENDRGGIC